MFPIGLIVKNKWQICFDGAYINPQSPLTRCFWVVTAALLSVILLYIGDKIGRLHLRTPANTIDPPVRDRKHTTAIYR